MRGRSRNNNNNKGPNPLTRSYESNGPDVKIRGTAQHIAEKYSQLARDAQASGDPVAAENYFQHAEHYFRIIAAAHEQLREQYGYQQRSFEEDGDDDGLPHGERPTFDRNGTGNGEDIDPGSQPQPFEARPDGERPARFERNDRGERQDRGDRGHRNDRFDRGDRQQDRRERFQRDRGPRQDAQRDEQPRLDLDRDEQRQERNQERNGRGDIRRERRREEAEAAEPGNLPAFLTNPPVRTTVAIESGEKATASAAPAAPAAQPEPANDEVEAPRPRRKRRTRAEIEAANAEKNAIETPAAE